MDSGASFSSSFFLYLNTRSLLESRFEHSSTMFCEPLFVLFSLLLFSISSVAARCWFPDGQTVATQDVPCSNSGNSTCCGPGFACLSNNICMATSYVINPPDVQFIRGSCTDQTWNDQNCPLFCDSPAADDNQNGGIGMQQCPNSNTTFYCMDPGQSSADCTESKNLVVFRGRHIVSTRQTTIYTDS
jgi:hypothetical protein